MGLRVLVWKTGGPISGQCCVCGKPFLDDANIATVYDLGAFQGHICQRCLELGPMGAGAEMHRLAERLDLIALRMGDLDPAKWPKTRPATEGQDAPGDAEIPGVKNAGRFGALKGVSVTGEKAF